MKTKLHLCAALFAALAMQGVAFAAHQPGHPDKAAKSSGRESTRITTTDDTPMMTRVARYPGRVGGTVMRTPRILAETFGGERSLISKRGLFQSNEEASDAEISRSVPQGRGQRTPVR